MHSISSNDLDTLRGSLHGGATGPADAAFDDARQVWNAAVDRRPAVVVHCADVQDVVTALAFAREHSLPVCVRGGAHSVGGGGVVEGGVVVDLRSLNQVTVDPVSRRARVGGGALLGELDAATQAHGLAAPAGVVSHTGIGGLTLGGGMGWLTRTAGLTIDNLVSAQVVTADGRVLRAAPDENPDLLWALRGGGGNFGAVTELELRLHRVDPMVDFAMLFWPLGRGAEMLRVARELIPGLSRDLNVIVGALHAPPAPFVPVEHQRQPCYVLMATGFGAPDAHAELLARIRATAPPAFELVTPMPYVALQQLIDEPNAWGGYHYEKACYVEELTDAAIDVIAEHVARTTSPDSLVLFYRLDEAYSEVAEEDTAFSGGRSPRYAGFIVGGTLQEEQLGAERAWVRAFWEALRPHSIGVGSYINGEAEFEDERVRASFGPEKYARLEQVKGRYDPDNVFRPGANIKPARAAATPVG